MNSNLPKEIWIKNQRYTKLTLLWLPNHRQWCAYYAHERLNRMSKESYGPTQEEALDRLEEWLRKENLL